MITDIARKEVDLDTLKAGASLIPVAKITKVPKVVKAIGNVGKTGSKKGKEGEKTVWKRFTQKDQPKPDKNKGNQSKTGSKSGITTSKPNQEEVSKSSQTKQTKAKNKGGSGARTETTRVGRWMSQAEYDKMVKTKVVQESYSGTTHVANPASIDAFGKQAKPGQVYVEFDVPTTSLKQTNKGWAKILGSNTLEGRLAAKKGNPIPDMPTATNIKIVGVK